MNDPGTIVRDYLLSQGSLTTLVSERVYAECDYPPVTYRIAQGPAICFKIRGGDIDPSEALQRPSVQFKCYGRTEQEANTLYRTLHSMLHGKKSESIRWAYLEVLGQTLSEPETDWPFVLVFYRMFITNA